MDGIAGVADGGVVDVGSEDTVSTGAALATADADADADAGADANGATETEVSLAGGDAALLDR